MGAKSWEEGTSGVQQLPHRGRRRDGRACRDSRSAPGHEERLSQHPGQVTMPGAVAGWARVAPLHYPGSGGGSKFQPPLVLECLRFLWWGPKPCLMGVSCCLPFPLQQSGRCPHPSQALPPEYEQLPGYAELWLPLRDMHRAEVGPPDIPVYRQGQGRCRPQKQDKPPGLWPSAPALPAGGRPGPDSVVLGVAGTQGSCFPRASSARHPP